MSERVPTKATLRALERVFVAEIEGRLPFQSRARIYQRLATEGLVEGDARTFGTGWSAVTVHGWALTHAGRYLYGQHCERLGEEETA